MSRPNRYSQRNQANQQHKQYTRDRAVGGVSYNCNGYTVAAVTSQRRPTPFMLPITSALREEQRQVPASTADHSHTNLVTANLPYLVENLAQQPYVNTTARTTTRDSNLDLRAATPYRRRTSVAQRRNIRLHAATPYQRITNSAQHTLENNQQQAQEHQYARSCNTGANFSALEMIRESYSCSCAKCKAREVRVRHTNMVAAANEPQSSNIIVCISNSSSECESSGIEASANHLQDLRQYESNHNNNNNNSRNFLCSICLETYLTKRPMVTLCGHIFCRICILESLNYLGKCPICNRKLNLTNVLPIFL